MTNRFIHRFSPITADREHANDPERIVELDRRLRYAATLPNDFILDSIIHMWEDELDWRCEAQEYDWNLRYFDDIPYEETP